MAALGAVLNAHLVDEVKRAGGLFTHTYLEILQTGGAENTNIEGLDANYILAFLDGVNVALVIATVLIVLAALAAAAFARDEVAVTSPPPV